MSARLAAACLVPTFLCLGAIEDVSGQASAPPSVARPTQAQRLPSREDRRAELQKLGDAVRLEAEARAEVAAAEKAAAKARDEEKQAAAAAAEKRLAEARRKLVIAQRALAKQRVVVLRNSAAYPNAIEVREEVDAQDPLERFAVLTPGGPVIVEAAITIDGQPFRMQREKLVDQLLAAADTDQDGKTSWAEALKTPRFTLGRIQGGNAAREASLLRTFDTNGNGEVERVEARRFIAYTFRAPAFTLSSGTAPRQYVLSAAGRVNRYAGQTNVLGLLDEDGDNLLSKEELAAAGQRLKSRDADDNDLLDASELRGSGSPTNRQLRVARRPQQAPTGLAVLLGPTAKAAPLFQALKARYGNDDGEIVAGSFPELPKLFASLDGNDDGKLQAGEVLKLNEVSPHVELAVRLGDAETNQGLTLKSTSSELEKRETSKSSATVALPGIEVAFSGAVGSRRQVIDYARFGKSYVGRFDKNNNGYLEKDELPVNFARQFENWDGDGDGKAYAKEISESYERMQAPQKTQVRAAAASQGDPLFDALDLSGDNRLSLREMKTASAQLKKFDENQDGRISRSEIPVALAVRFGSGGQQFQTLTVQARQRRNPGAAPLPDNGAPEWFNRMDRNGDGDVTLKEFLGGKEAFNKIDANGDGFIEPEEAKKAAGKSAK